MERHRRKTKQEIDKTVNEIHRLQVLGASPTTIMQQLSLTEHNYYDTYIPKLNKKWKNIWEKKTIDDIYAHSQEFGERLSSAYTNARTKAREENASPGWGALEQELGMLLFQYNREQPIIVEKLRELEQETPRLDGSTEESSKAIILRREKPDSNQDGGIDNSTTESDTSQRKF